MNYSKIPHLILEICKGEAIFKKKVEKLHRTIGKWDLGKLEHHLRNVSFIPEMYEHDSAEEKLYAKYCDILVHTFFKLYGMESRLYTERGDFPDVIGNYKNKYTIVADAKTFRLSRTALNPKDYKIDALNRWRRNAGADYACLVGPLHEFPKERSRLFREAVDNNVTLLSYTHLLFIILADKWQSIDLTPIWDIGTSFSNQRDVNASIWWGKLGSLLQNIKSKTNFEQLEREYYANLAKQAQQQIRHWEKEKTSLQNLSKEELVKELISSMGIEQKIAQIRRKISRFSKSQSLTNYA